MAKKASAIVAAARAKMRAEKGEATRVGTALASSYVIGAIEKSPEQLAKIPTVFGLPRTFTLAALAKGAAMFSPKGTTTDVLNGIGDAAAIIAVHAYAKGETVAGFNVGDELSGPRKKRKRQQGAMRERLKALEERLTDELGDGDEEELDAAIGALEGVLAGLEG